MLAICIPLSLGGTISLTIAFAIGKFPPNTPSIILEKIRSSN